MSVDVRPPAVPPDVPADGHVNGHIVLDAPGGQIRTGRRRRRPNLSGDLRTLLQEPPSFRRSLRGYDRLQVENYVRWAEEELAAEGRTLDDLLLRHTRLRADLDEAHRLLSHSGAGREFLHLASRVGAVLCVAADEAAKLREDAATEAGRLVEHASADAQRATDEAAAEAERISMEARAEAAARLAKAQDIERRAGEESARLLAEAERQRAQQDREAIAARERLDREAQERRRAVETAAEALERRCHEARTYLDRIAGQVAEVLTALGSPPQAGSPGEGAPPVPRSAG